MTEQTQQPELQPHDLNNVAETLVFPLYVRALESQRPDALIKDERAVALVSNMAYNFSKIQQVKLDEFDQVTLILRSREFDRYAQDFLARHPDARVVHIGCGLDTRFERVDNGQVEWYDLDLPNVIALRQQLIGEEAGPFIEGRYHHLAYSAFDLAWLDPVKARGPRPTLFMAEGVFMYFPEAQIRALVLALREQFPGAELVFDAFSPFLVRVTNLRFALTHFGARYHWALKRGQDLEGWANASSAGEAIQLLDEWSYFDSPEPRLDPVRWMQHIPFWARVLVIYHYRLGA